MKHIVPALVALGILAAAPPASAAEWNIDFEAAMVSAVSNDVSIPSETGTRFSLTDDLGTDDDVAFRVRLGVRLGRRHHISALYAPLTLYGGGRVDFPITFNDVTFAAGEHLSTNYRFNSYRATWRYDLARNDRVTFGLGLTGKVRDAEISLAGDTASTSYDNVGFVPLLHLRLHWKLTGKVGLLLEADAAAAPGGQGRAEDVLAAVDLHPWRSGSLRLGYRFLEGGADVEDVYSFAFIQYWVFGWSQRF
jgi:hypothetical protein